MGKAPAPLYQNRPSLLLISLPVVCPVLRRLQPYLARMAAMALSTEFAFFTLPCRSASSRT